MKTHKDPNHTQSHVQSPSVATRAATPTLNVGGVLLSVAILSGSLLGCASRPSPERVNSPQSVAGVPEFYVVKRGDTVSRIAARYGLSYPEIGRINQLDAQYTIQVDQRLRLRGAASATSSSGNRPAVTRAAVARPIAVQPTTPIRRQPLPASTATTATTAISTPTAIVASPQSSQQTWRWPTTNPILQQFNPAAQIKGIRFAGQSGDPVLAAAAGEVVYANNGLPEYGNLVLLRHRDGYITAYAHNQQLLVQEGQTVDIGQPIAAFGDSGSSRVMLEFQVRKNGKPIDPKQVLPSR